LSSIARQVASAARACLIDLSRSNPMLHSERWFVIGDSHVGVFRAERTVLVRHLGAITLNRAGRSGEAEQLLRRAMRWPYRVLERLPFPVPRSADVIILSFGEIDVRCHVQQQIQRGPRTGTDVLQDLANSAATLVGAVHASGPATVVFLAIPPPGEAVDDPEYPAYGTLKDRAEWTTALNFAVNTRLRDEFGVLVGFADYSASVANRDGMMRPEFSDDNIHLSPRALPILRRAVQSAIANRTGAACRLSSRV
jgi:hypothetical protein